MVTVDEEVIGRVFSNLVDNALKFTPLDGYIQVKAMADGGQDQDWVLCTVADTGSGIPKNSLDVVFDRFRQGGLPSQGRRKGMGIGLHYCRVAIEAHGGRIWVESREGSGTTFHLTLPRAAWTVVE